MAREVQLLACETLVMRNLGVDAVEGCAVVARTPGRRVQCAVPCAEGCRDRSVVCGAPHTARELAAQPCI